MGVNLLGRFTLWLQQGTQELNKTTQDVKIVSGTYLRNYQACFMIKKPHESP